MPCANGRTRPGVKGTTFMTITSITRVSTAADGTEGNKDSIDPAFSPDGTKVAFHSYASNLVSSDANAASDVFVKNLITDDITRCSTAASGVEGNRFSENPSISGDGTIVAFESYANNLVIGDTNNILDVFVKNVVSSEVVLASTPGADVQGNGVSANPALSADGRFIAFTSLATNLVSNDTNNVEDVFRKDLVTGAIARVSSAINGVQANDYSSRPTISGDGRYVAFQSRASNIVSDDSNFAFDVFLRDLVGGTIVRVSTSAIGAQANGPSYSPAISPDGRFVAFESHASNLVPGDDNNNSDVFVKDIATGAISLVSITLDGTQGDGWSVNPSISADGRFVAFESRASNLVPEKDTTTNE